MAPGHFIEGAAKRQQIHVFILSYKGYFLVIVLIGLISKYEAAPEAIGREHRERFKD